MATDFYVTGIPAVLDDAEGPALEVGSVALELRDVIEERDASADSIREFEALTGLEPQVYRLVPVGSIWEV